MAPADAAARQRHPVSLAARRSPALHGRAWGGAGVFVSVCECVSVCVCVCVCAEVGPAGRRGQLHRGGEAAGLAGGGRGSLISWF